MMTKVQLCLAVIQQFQLQNPAVDIFDKNYDQNFIFKDPKVAIAWGYMNEKDPEKYPINKEYLKDYANSKSRDVTLFGYTNEETKEYFSISFKELLDMLPENEDFEMTLEEAFKYIQNGDFIDKSDTILIPPSKEECQRIYEEKYKK